MPRYREAFVEYAVSFFRVVSGLSFPFDEADVRERAGAGFDRAFQPMGFKRHFAAVVASKGRYRALRSLRVQTVVDHGTQDSLILPTGGRATVQAIPGARLHRHVWPDAREVQASGGETWSCLWKTKRTAESMTAERRTRHHE